MNTDQNGYTLSTHTPPPDLNTRTIPSVRRGFALIFSGGLTYAVCQWLLVVLIAKLGTPEMLGTFALGLAISAPVMLFCDMRLRVIQASDATGRNQFNEYVAVRIITSTVAFIVITVAAMALGYRGSVFWVILLIGVAKVIESLSDVIYGFLQKHERPGLVGGSLTLKGLLSLVLVGTGLYWTGSLLWATAGLCLAWLILLLVFDIPNLGKLLRQTGDGPSDSGPFHWLARGGRPPVLQSLIGLALPMGVVAALASFGANIPRYFLEAFQDREALGYFAALAYVAIAPGRVVVALGEATAARIARAWVAPGKSFERLIFKLSILVGLVCVAGIAGAMLVGEPALTYLYRPEYARFADTLVVVMIYAAFASVASWLSFVLTATRSLRSQAALAVVATGMTALLSALLIPANGIKGAAWALVISNGIQALGAVVLIARAISVRGKAVQLCQC
jgi:O-antigen/teichoic acid export membrane protein